MDLEDIRRQKLAELQRAQQQSSEEDFVGQQIEAAKKTLLQRFLTKEARERLATVRMANKGLAEQIEMALVEAAHSGQIQGQIDEEKLKEILNRATGKKREFRIIH